MSKCPTHNTWLVEGRCNSCHKKTDAMKSPFQFFTETTVGQSTSVSKSNVPTGPECSGCRKPINDSGAEIGGKTYHAECLKCHFCKVVLSAGAIFISGGSPACREHSKKLPEGYDPMSQHGLK